MLKECSDCGCEFTPYSSQEIRCKECQVKYRKGYQQEYQFPYHEKYKVDKPKAMYNPRYYQYWKFVKELQDDEVQALYAGNIQKLKHATTWKEFQEIKTCLKILCFVYRVRVGDRTLSMHEEMVVDNNRFHKELMEYE